MREKKTASTTPNSLVYLLRALIFLLFLWRRLCLFFFHFHLICGTNMTQSELNFSDHPFPPILPPSTSPQFHHKLGAHCRVDFPCYSKHFLSQQHAFDAVETGATSVLTRFLNRVLGNLTTLYMWISRLTQTYTLTSQSCIRVAQPRLVLSHLVRRTADPDHHSQGRHTYLSFRLSIKKNTWQTSVA